jgi:phosphoribosyl-ATP pyrophosphohydrolase
MPDDIVMSEKKHPSVLEQLVAVIQDRKANPPERSYTAVLLNGGVEKIGSKVLEEATEVVDAAANVAQTGRDPVIHEAADLFYHALVLLAFADTKWSDVEKELARRFGTCGLDEQESR